MPRKLRTPKERQRALTLDDLGIVDVLSFLSGWRPPQHAFDHERSRWQSWPEFLAEYEVVRDEVLAKNFGDRAKRGRPVFAEQARWFARQYGIDDLAAARYDEIKGVQLGDDGRFQ